jgi:hypothetical protein
VAAVETTLKAAQAAAGRLDGGPAPSRDPLDDRVVENLLAGYAYVDDLVAARIDVFALGGVKHLLELNTLVLCGTSQARRAAHAGHLAATERRFYEERAAGVQDVVEWYARYADRAPWTRAAGVYVRTLSTPQLFIEGNHRTGALMMSYVLLRDGCPPFVLSPANAREYFEPSTAIRHVDKRSLISLLRAATIRRHLAGLLKAHADPRHLRR